MLCADGSNLDARRNLLVGAMLAGQAFANAPVAGVHALAYPLGGHFHVPHGLSNALVLPHVMRFTAPAAGELYGEIAQELGISGGSDGLITWFERLMDTAGLERRLSDVGVCHDDLAVLADDAMLQQRLLVNNMRAIDRDDAFAIYKAAL